MWKDGIMRMLQEADVLPISKPTKSKPVLSTRARNALLHEFSRVPEPHEMVDVIRQHRLVRELGWPLYTVLLSFKNVGRKTAKEIADYAGIKR